jgi:hypothetical protein
MVRELAITFGRVRGSDAGDVVQPAFYPYASMTERCSGGRVMTDGNDQGMDDDGRAVHARVVGPDSWAQAQNWPVPMRLVRPVRTGMGIGLGILIVQVIAAIIVLVVLGLGLLPAPSGEGYVSPPQLQGNESTP